ncbi:MAG: hypothetical protein DWQ34_10535 [Planctomycetota bacterium]|nr:MAG: hypothetical protein DWQ29_14615 [Planctomycetota bacterium]REJ93483.1 MAG: hypothetical protein DWQ34_10535 [Planctomycetota bacterium]REK23204.1 MAG: hypothetical protein DWQ41_17405 [Planctomycetota bacterium]REK30877.1 MAG: hypothetical protein DWQ45_20785 [Planctomycetota bacterium]
MRKLMILGILAASISVQSGCIVPIWNANPDIRTRELIYTSESYRHATEIWERVWFLEAPDYATPYRTHGGVI